MSEEINFIIYVYLWPLDRMLAIFDDDLRARDSLIKRYYQIPTLSIAIIEREENVVKYLVTQGQKLTDKDYLRILMFCSADLLEWLYQHEIKFPKNSVLYTIRHNILRAYKFFVSKGHTITYADLTEALNQGYYSYRDILEYDKFQGYYSGNLDQVFDEYKDIMTYIIESGIKPKVEDYEEAVDRRDIQMTE